MSRRGSLGRASVLALLGPLAACAPRTDPAASVQLSGEVRPQPPRVGPASVELSLSEHGQPLAGAQLRVEGNMNHAGMQPSPARVEELGEGRYEARLEFTMGGDWFLLVEGTLADGRRLERTLGVPGVARD